MSPDSDSSGRTLERIGKSRGDRKSGVLNFVRAQAFSVGKLARLAPAGKKLHEYLKGRRTAGIVERRRPPQAL